MSKKVFTILLLAVFMLAQFTSASAATLAGTVTLATLPTFSDAFNVDLDWSVTGMPGGATQNVFAWGRMQTNPAANYLPANCYLAASLPGVSGAAGTFTYNYNFAFDQQAWEFTLTVDDAADCNSATPPAVSSVMGSTFIDFWWLEGFIANPPSLAPDFFSQLPVACNTFELWGVASDQVINTRPTKAGFNPLLGYSGFESWNQSVTGTFVPPAPLGPADALLSWVYTFPSTASGDWTFSVDPTDFAGNNWGTTYFRDFLAISPDELADCLSFSDTSGTDTEVYVRYMAQLDLAHGYLDGTFRPDSTLTRAEMAAFIELANGVKDTDPLFGTPPSAGSSCNFSDVSTDDWFAGWVWQACADGYMIGLGGGLFGSNDSLTRGQVVTALENINIMGTGNGYLNTENVFQGEWGNLYREALFADVSIGAFYALPVQHAYGVGVVEGTSETTFSPDQAILRGEFVKMMYRALSRIRSQRCVECN
jgi:hypothetical protein